MIKVMVVDDSPLVRKIVSDLLNSTPDTTVVGTAYNAEFAIQKIPKIKPDVITMDIEMPGMGGLEAIKRIMATNPIPIVVLSAFAKRGAELTIQALEYGAVDFVTKPVASLSGGIDRISKELVEKVRNAASIDIAKINNQLSHHEDIVNKNIEVKTNLISNKYSFDIVAIGTSTGGPVALKKVLQGIPEDFPTGIVVVQHMPPIFTNAFANRLNSICHIKVKEAKDGDPITPGTALIAPGDFHMTVTKFNNPHISLHRWEPVSGHRPSVDVLMHSVTREYGKNALAVIMTGMGKDGAEGIHELKKRGGYVIAQDQETSVIFGMNREVIENGDADEIVPVDEISRRLVSKIQKIEKKVV